jgi:indole-3-glycerol phosphate synthase
VDVNNSLRLRKLAPPEVLFVSESGIKTPEDIQKLYDNRTNAVLIGETLMRAPDKRAMLAQLRGGTTA